VATAPRSSEPGRSPSRKPADGDQLSRQERVLVARYAPAGDAR
jgi:hypothetical protein